jgi:conflict system STAND superfamily ATPase
MTADPEAAVPRQEPAVPPQDNDHGRKPEQQEQEPQAKSEPSADEDFSADYGRSAMRLMSVVNNFHGQVDAGGASFGFAGETRFAASPPGELARAVVEELVQGFVPPQCVDAAADRLNRTGMVVLTGLDGVGKQALALHLLMKRVAKNAGFVKASPANTLARLADQEYKFGVGYVVVDLVGDNANSSVLRFEAERLAKSVRQSGAYLVITTTSRQLNHKALPDFAVDVAPPDAEAVLLSHLNGAVVSTELLDKARQYISTRSHPGDVAALARLLVSDPDTANTTMDDEPYGQVIDWLASNVTKKDLLAVTALAVAGEQSEQMHDSLTRLLMAHMEQAQEAREAAPHIAPAEEVLAQRVVDHPLYTSDLREDGDSDVWLDGRRLRFRHRDHREHILLEMHRRYDHNLWRPVESWLLELCGNNPRDEVQVQVAVGLALLARANFTEIRRKYLDRWANGTVSERTTAAMVLQAMSSDSRLAPVALNTALEWGEDSGIKRGVTSAIALGGALGMRFPDEAMRRLVFLSLRAKRIGIVARYALGSLFAVSVDAGPEHAARVLAMVADEVRKVATRQSGKNSTAESADALVAEHERTDRDTAGESLDEDAERYERGLTVHVVRAARWMVVALLRAEQADNEQPVIRKVLLEQPDNVDAVGALWAEALCSAPHRAAAIAALRDVLESLRDESDAKDSVARLGAAIYAAMLPSHRELRGGELVRELTGRRARSNAPHVLLSTFLGAMRATTKH